MKYNRCLDSCFICMWTHPDHGGCLYSVLLTNNYIYISSPFHTSLTSQPNLIPITSHWGPRAASTAQPPSLSSYKYSNCRHLSHLNSPRVYNTCCQKRVKCPKVSLKINFYYSVQKWVQKVKKRKNTKIWSNSKKIVPKWTSSFLCLLLDKFISLHFGSDYVCLCLILTSYQDILLRSFLGKIKKFRCVCQFWCHHPC